MSTRSGREFGKYTLVHRLAVGEVTEAYLCRLYGIEVVVRRLRPGVTDPTVVSSFLAEARLASALDHPNIIKVHEITEHEGTPFVVLEHVRGPNLARIVQATAQDPASSWGEIAMIFAAIARGVAHAHAVPTPQGEHLEIVHGGISLENIVVSDEGSPKLYDFGLAHARGTVGLTPRDDLRALGRCLYHASTGHAPTPRPIRPRALVADYPAMLDEIVWAALDPDDTRRFSGVDVFVAALEAFVALPGIAATTRPLADFLDGLQLDFDEPVSFGSAHGYGALAVAPRATVSTPVLPSTPQRRSFAFAAAAAVALGALVTALAAPRFFPSPTPATLPAPAPEAEPEPEVTPQPLVTRALPDAIPTNDPEPVVTAAPAPPPRKPVPAPQRPTPRPRPATVTAHRALPDAAPKPEPVAAPKPEPLPSSPPASASASASVRPAPLPASASASVPSPSAPAPPEPAPAPATPAPIAVRKAVTVPTPLRLPGIYFVSSSSELTKMLSLVEREAVSVGKLPAATVRGTTRGLVPLLTPRLLPGQSLEIHPIAIYNLLVRSGLEGQPPGAISAELRRQQAAGKL